MKLVEIPRTPLGPITLDAAFELVFGDATLARVHGPNVKIAPWSRAGARAVEFVISLEAAPAEVKHLLQKDRIRVTAKQRCTRSEGERTLEVVSDIKLHFFAWRLFSVRARFVLEHDAATSFTFIYGTTEHRARLPVPLNAIVETFMMVHSERELQRFAEILKERINA